MTILPLEFTPLRFSVLLVIAVDEGERARERESEGEEDMSNANARASRCVLATLCYEYTKMHRRL